jgi:chromosome segregation ATPase
MAPFEARASELSERLEVGRAKIRNLEQQLRKAELEQNALKASTQPAALEQIAALELLRDAARGEIQSLNVELVPSSDDLADVKREIAKRLDELWQLNEQQQRLSETADRNEDRQRIAAGGALSAHREALRSLANAAVRNQLAELAQQALNSAAAAEAPIAAQRQDEDLLRKALASYDHAAYQRGMRLAASAVMGTFLLFLLLIAF